MRWLIIALMLMASGCAPFLSGLSDGLSSGGDYTSLLYLQQVRQQNIQLQQAQSWNNYYQMQRNQSLWNINQNLQGMRYGY